jgi:hypothetical protein
LNCRELNNVTQDSEGRIRKGLKVGKGKMVKNERKEELAFE